MNTGELLLRAILTDPADDHARLVYADYLDEVAERHTERADLIRQMVQRPTWFADATCLEHGDTNDAAYLHALEWFKDGSADKEMTALVGGAWSTLEGHWVWHRGQLVAQDFHAVYRRGFIESVTCTAADFMRHARALFSAHPITRVTLTDRSPLGDDDVGGPHEITWRAWFRDRTRTQSMWPNFLYYLPAPIFDCLADGELLRGHDGTDELRRYPTADDTPRLDISEACVRHGRREAGLPDLTRAQVGAGAVPTQQGEETGND